MSPVSTATRSLRGKASNVFSSRLVLPDPGELIRLTTSTSFSRKRSRSSAAIRSFSLRTFFSSGTRLMLLQLQICQFQLFPADALVARAAALRAAEVVVLHIELSSAVKTAVTARTDLDFQVHALQFRVANQSFKAEAQSIRINRRQLTDANRDFRPLRAGMPLGLCLNRVDHGLCDAQFVHRKHLAVGT